MSDQRRVDSLISGSLPEEEEWAAITELAKGRLADVFPLAKKLIASASPRKRELGADILGALASSGSDEKSTAARAPLTRLLVRETESHVLAAAVVGLGHAEATDRVTELAQFATHESSDVRAAVAFSLPALLAGRLEKQELDQAEITPLISLTSDSDLEVRDWATFGLGLLLRDLDTPEVRAALSARTQDPDPQVRCEALEGLGLRGDLVALAEALRSCDVRVEAVLVAEQAADPALEEPLLELRPRWRGDPSDLERALAASRR